MWPRKKGAKPKSLGTSDESGEVCILTASQEKPKATELVKRLPEPGEKRDNIECPGFSVQNHRDQEAEKLCSCCEHIKLKDFFEDDPRLSGYLPKRSLATTTAERHCLMCRLFLDTLRMSGATGQIYIGLRYYINIEDGFRSSSFFTRETSSIHRILPVTPSTEHSGGAFARPCLMFVDLTLVASWLSSCNRGHGAACQPDRPHRSSTIDFRVVDVRRGCVTSAALDWKYVALSYVWGNVDQMMLTQHTFPTLAREGALFLDFPRLPRTIQDAIILCQELGERYLWVDSLCILQDSLEDKYAQILHMDTVYQFASLTVIAAAGDDCNSGLPGMPNRPRTHDSMKQPSATFKGIKLAAVLDSVNDEIEASVWNKRAWTLQERVFSTRCLVFTQNRVFFSCAEAFWREDICTEFLDSPAAQRTLARQYDTMRIPDAFLKTRKGMELLKLYENLVTSYLGRQLSEESDVIRAFSGFLSALRPYLGEPYYGLPGYILTLAMSWNTTLRYDPLRTEPGPSKRDGFPTWSWAGWVYPTNAKVIIPPGGSNYRIQTVWRITDATYSVKHINTDFLPNPEFRRIKSHMRSSSEKSIRESLLHLRLPSKLLPQLLVFHTSSAFLSLKRTMSSSHWMDSVECEISHPRLTSRHQFDINRQWLQSHPGDQEFIVISGADYDDHTTLQLMLIYWVGNIAYRVALKSGWMSENDWVKLNPQRRLIVLG
jgi:hypothetical protein